MNQIHNFDMGGTLEDVLNGVGALAEQYDDNSEKAKALLLGAKALLFVDSEKVYYKWLEFRDPAPGNIKSITDRIFSHFTVHRSDNSTNGRTVGAFGGIEEIIFHLNEISRDLKVSQSTSNALEISKSALEYIAQKHLEFNFIHFMNNWESMESEDTFADD